jgi:ketosteroid isomerase-like protein
MAEETSMKKAWALFLAIVSLGVAALVPGNSRPADDETQLIQLERAWNQAEASTDPAAITSLFEDTLVYVDYDGSLMNKTEYLRSVGNPVAKPDHMYDEGMKVYVYGNTGIVSGVYRETGTSKGKPYTRRARFTDTWVKRNGQWKCAASHSTLIQ